MKKVIWVWSLNQNGKILGIRFYAGGLTFHPYKFQRELPKALGSDWEVEFVSLDLANDDKLIGDVIVLSENTKRFVKRDFGLPMVTISEQALLSLDYTAITNQIKAAVL